MFSVISIHLFISQFLKLGLIASISKVINYIYNVYCEKPGEITPKGVFLRYLPHICALMNESWYVFSTLQYTCFIPI